MESRLSVPGDGGRYPTQNMHTKHPTIAFTIGMFNAVDGPSYCVYTQAYGMEMQVDDEWPLNILIMAPPHLVSSMTSEADVASKGMIPGASYTPGDGNYEQIVEHGGRWVLARPSDDLAQIATQKLGILLLVDDQHEVDSIASVDGLTSENLIIAFKIDSVSTINTAKRIAANIQGKLPGKLNSTQILVSGSFEHSNLVEYLSVDGVSGLLLLDASFDAMLELIETVVE